MNVWCQQCTYTQGEVDATCKCCGAIYRPGKEVYESLEDIRPSSAALKRNYLALDNKGKPIRVGDTVLILLNPSWKGKGKVVPQKHVADPLLQIVLVEPQEGQMKGYCGGFYGDNLEKIG